MALKADEVKRVAELAKLNLTNDEIKKFGGQLSDVVDYFKQLNEVDTQGTEPTSQTTGLSDVGREDAIDPQQSLSVSEALSGTEETLNDYFVVGAVINRDQDS